jgi:hypothetical protein
VSGFVLHVRRILRSTPSFPKISMENLLFQITWKFYGRSDIDVIKKVAKQIIPQRRVLLGATNDCNQPRRPVYVPMTTELSKVFLLFPFYKYLR